MYVLAKRIFLLEPEDQQISGHVRQAVIQTKISDLIFCEGLRTILCPILLFLYPRSSVVAFSSLTSEAFENASTVLSTQ